MWLDEDGLLWHRIDVPEITVEAAEEVKRVVEELTGGQPVPAVVDIRSVAYADIDVRRIFAGSIEESFELATALIVGASASRAMARAYTEVARPARPVAVFTSEAAAAEWARAFLPGEGEG